MQQNRKIIIYHLRWHGENELLMFQHKPRLVRKTTLYLMRVITGIPDEQLCFCYGDTLL
jgi:hypothetical protein